MDAKKLLLEIFDKLLLGVSGLLLVAYLALAFLAGSPADKAREQVASYNRRIVELKEKAALGAPKAEGSDATKAVDAALRGGPPGELLPPWLFHKKPVVEVRVEAEQGPEAAHGQPADFTGKPGLGQIALKWHEGKNVYVVPTAYKVFRAQGEPKDFQEVKSLDGKAQAYVDKDVQTRTSYWYFVEETVELDKTNDMVKKGKVTPLEPSQVTVRTEQIGPFVTDPDTFVEPLSARPKTTLDDIRRGEPEHEADAYVKVWRWFEQAGEWKSSAANTYKKGEKIAPEKEGKLDYATDFVLDDVKTRQVKKEDVGATLTQTIVVLRDTKTNQTLELVVGEPDEGLKRARSWRKGDGEAPPKKTPKETEKPPPPEKGKKKPG